MYKNVTKNHYLVNQGFTNLLHVATLDDVRNEHVRLVGGVDDRLEKRIVDNRIVDVGVTDEGGVDGDRSGGELGF